MRIVAVLAFLLASVSSVKAEEGCDWIPDFICELFVKSEKVAELAQLSRKAKAQFVENYEVLLSDKTNIDVGKALNDLTLQLFRASVISIARNDPFVAVPSSVEAEFNVVTGVSINGGIEFKVAVKGGAKKEKGTVMKVRADMPGGGLYRDVVEDCMRKTLKAGPSKTNPLAECARTHFTILDSEYYQTEVGDNENIGGFGKKSPYYSYLKEYISTVKNHRICHNLENYIDEVTGEEVVYLESGVHCSKK